MNILKFLNKHGKVALSAMQAVGLTAVVGAAGVAAFQFLGSPEEDNFAFNVPQYNPGEVVYVASGNAGDYQSGAYSGKGSAKSGPLSNISAKSVNRMDRQAQLEKVQAEMAEEYTQMQVSSSAESTSSGYQMGDSEGGLGLLGNATNEDALKNNPMATAMQQTMGNMQNVIANAQAQAAKQSEAGKPAALSSASPNWGAIGDSNGGGNAGVNMSFAVQNSGKNVQKGNSLGGAANTPDGVVAMQAQATQMLEGMRLQGKSSFGPTGVNGGYKDASIKQSKKLDGANTDLVFAQKTSIEVGKNKHRSANEGARAFLASSELSGGLMISSENFETGAGQSSKDFSSDLNTSLRGIKTWTQDEVTPQEIEREQDRTNLQNWLLVAIGSGIAAMIAIPFLKNIPIWGWAAALGVSLAALALCTTAIVKAAQYAQKWGGEGLSTATGLVAIAMMLGIGASWIWSSAFKSFYSKVGDILGIGTDSATGTTAGTTATGTAGATSSSGSGMAGVFSEQAKQEMLLGEIFPKG